MLDDSFLCAKFGATDTTGICRATRGEVSIGVVARLWWQIKQHRVPIAVVVIVLVVVIAIIIIGYWFDWTGFNGYNKVTIHELVLLWDMVDNSNSLCKPL
jgi:tetrahydromethanopterin S-methyltransferase subunit E